MANLASNLLDTASGHAGRVAVRVSETAVTYEDLAQASSRVAGMLRERGVRGPGGVRAVRDIAGGLVQPPGPPAQARLDRNAYPRGPDARGGQGGQRGPAGGRGRDRDPGAQRDEGLLAQARGHGQSHTGRLVPHRRHGPGRRRRLLRAHVKSQVAAYKYPRLVWIADELPKGATGKILKREIVPPTGPDLK